MMRRLLAVLLIVALAGATTSVSAQTVQVTPLPKDGRILVTLRMTDVFTDEVRAAMHSGLRITFVYDIELKRSTALEVTLGEDGLWHSDRLVMENLQSGKSTEIHVLRRDPRPSFDESLFTVESLRAEW